MSTIEDIESSTVGEIAASDIRKAEVFRKMGIDFCCGGRMTLKEAARQAGITAEQLKEAMEKAPAAPASHPQHDFSSWDLGFLADYIYNVHHRYIRENAPVLENLSKKVAGRHGAQHPELIPLSRSIRDFLHHLLSHLTKEENVLFPIIRQLTHDYALPADACNSYTYLFEKMKEFEDDLFQHIHLENNILFPRALQR